MSPAAAGSKSAPPRNFFAGLAADMSGELKGSSFTALHNGRAFAVTYERDEAGTLFEVALPIEATNAGVLTVATGNLATKAARWFGISSGFVIETGDPTFDAAHYLFYGDTVFGRAILSRPEKRAAIRALLRAGFTRVRIGPQVVAASARETVVARDLCAADIIAAVIDRLASLVVDLGALKPSASLAFRQSGANPAPVVAHKTRVSSGKEDRRVTLALVAGLALAALGHYGFPALDELSLLMHAMAWSAPALALALGWGWRAGGKPLRQQLLRVGDPTTAWMAFWMAIMIRPLIFAYGIAVAYGLAAVLNGLLDDAPATEHRVPVIRKEIDDEANYATVDSWRGSGSETIRVWYSEYRRLLPGHTTITIVTKPGRFGFEWLRSYRVDLEAGHTG
jgi:hypothetical protein